MLLRYEGRLLHSKRRLSSTNHYSKKHSLYQGNIMGNRPQILAIDQGTTSSRAIVFDLDGSYQGKVIDIVHQTY